MMMMIQDRASVFPPEAKRNLTLAQYLAEHKPLSQMRAALEDGQRREEKQRRKDEKDSRRQSGPPDIESAGR